MARYLDAESAAADGFTIEHDTDHHRFVLTQQGRKFGEAHYTLRGEHGIDFDHTVVDPELRGRGLSGILAQHALTDEIVRGRTIQASCWFIEGYLEKHPELRETGAPKSEA